MDEFGLKRSPLVVKLESKDDAEHWYRKLEKQRDDLDYEIDGAVFKVNDLDAHDTLGTRASNPRWAVAWKFPPRREVARIKAIRAQVGRTGALTPVADLEPVHIGGVEVSRVTLHNQDEIDRKDIRIGDHVRVERAGDVIPHVVEVLKKKRNGNEKSYTLPDECPVCGGAVSREKGEAVARCLNAQCPAVIRERVQHFGAKKALDIDGLGEATVEHLVRLDLVSTPAGLFNLKKKDAKRIPGFAGKSAENLVKAIEDSKDRVTLSRLIYALGIPYVGTAMADELAGEFGTIDDLADASESALESMEGMGHTMAQAIRSWFKEEGNRDLVKRLKNAGLNPKARKRGKKLRGKTIVITGTLESMSRDEAEERVRMQGGNATGSVSGNTDYLVVGSNPGQKKMDAADEHETERLDEESFLSLVGSS